MRIYGLYKKVLVCNVSIRFPKNLRLITKHCLKRNLSKYLNLSHPSSMAKITPQTPLQQLQGFLLPALLPPATLSDRPEVNALHPEATAVSRSRFGTKYPNSVENLIQDSALAVIPQLLLLLHTTGQEIPEIRGPRLNRY